jgi:hypothetical protein
VHQTKQNEENPELVKYALKTRYVIHPAPAGADLRSCTHQHHDSVEVPQITHAITGVNASQSEAVQSTRKEGTKGALNPVPRVVVRGGGGQVSARA